MSNKPGIRKDLRQRLEMAEKNGSLLVATSEADSRRLRNAVSRGHLVSPARGVFADPQTWGSLKPDKRMLMEMRALQTICPDMVFCGPTAALAYGLNVNFAFHEVCHVAVPRKSHLSPTGMRGVVRHAYEAVEYVVENGFRVTPFDATVFDCLRFTVFRDGLPIADSALRDGRISKEQLSSMFEAKEPRAKGKRRAIDTLELADARAESGGESVARAVMIERGFSMPDLQKEFPNLLDGGEPYRADFYWEKTEFCPVVGELDGREKYRNPTMTGGRDAADVLADERLRESRISAAQVSIMRFSYKQLMDRTYFTRLMYSYGVLRDAAIPWVAVRDDDPEALASVTSRLVASKIMAWCPGLPMPLIT